MPRANGFDRGEASAAALIPRRSGNRMSASGGLPCGISATTKPSTPSDETATSSRGPHRRHQRRRAPARPAAWRKFVVASRRRRMRGDRCRRRMKGEVPCGFIVLKAGVAKPRPRRRKSSRWCANDRPGRRLQARDCRQPPTEDAPGKILRGTMKRRRQRDHARDHRDPAVLDDRGAKARARFPPPLPWLGAIRQEYHAIGAARIGCLRQPSSPRALASCSPISTSAVLRREAGGTRALVRCDARRRRGRNLITEVGRPSAASTPREQCRHRSRRRFSRPERSDFDRAARKSEGAFFSPARRAKNARAGEGGKKPGAIANILDQFDGRDHEPGPIPFQGRAYGSRA